MSGIVFLYPGVLGGLLLVPALFWLLRHARARREELLEALGGGHSAELARNRRERRRRDNGLLAAVVLLVLATARPVANPHRRFHPQGGRDMVFVLDVSRSMLAEDVRPSRLARAKADIAACLELPGNNRVGLVAFAGESAILSPLTGDVDFLRMMLETATPGSVARGSTYLQSALEKTTGKMLAPGRKGLQDVILLTDGEDQGSHPGETLAGLNAAGARLLVIGYGDPQFGARIPVANRSDSPAFLIDQGREVWTKLCEAPLRGLANASIQGKYLRGGTPGFDLANRYRRWSSQAPRVPLAGKGELEYTELFAWFLIPALLLLLWPLAWNFALWSAPVLWRFGFCATLTVPVSGTGAIAGPSQLTIQSARGLAHSTMAFQRGVTLLKTDAFADAATAFDEAAAGESNAARLALCLYNGALAYAHQAQRAAAPGSQLAGLDSAIPRMRRALLLRPDWLNATRGLEILYRRKAAAELDFKVQNAVKDQIAALIDELRRLLGLEQKLVEEVSESGGSEEWFKLMEGRQTALNQDTELARERLTEIDLKLRKALQAEDPSVPLSFQTTGFEPTHLETARSAQDQAVAALGRAGQLPTAAREIRRARDGIAAAIKALTDKSDPGQGELVEKTPEHSAADQSSMQANSAGAGMDLARRELPNPNFTAEELLQEEKSNAESRARHQPARVGEGEKDW